MRARISGLFIRAALSSMVGAFRTSGRTRALVMLVVVVAALTLPATALPATALPATALTGVASAAPNAAAPVDPMSDEALVRSLAGGFSNGYATVNGTRLHYVIGGKGTPLVLLGGWPQTWWQYHKIMPALAEHHRVIAVDLRGMGGSDKPAGGYDKKTMANDIYELVRHLGYRKVDIAGHDIGSKVAFSFAANHPDATRKVAMLDVLHPDESYYQYKLLPPSGWQTPPPYYLWWFAFNQVRGLPERLVSGRSRYLIDWLVNYGAKNRSAITDRDRAVYARAYNYPDAIRASNGWYQTFGQDIVDQRAYGKLTAPILGLGGSLGYPSLRALLPTKGTDVRVVRVANSGHFIAEEQPDAVISYLNQFFA